MNTNNANIHVLVAPSPFYGDSVMYRRHRIAEFLLKQPETDKVIWIAPKPSGRIGVLFDDPVAHTLQNGIREILVHDFKGIAAHLSCRSKSIMQRITGETAGQSRFYLWYTYPAFPGLSGSGIWDSVIYDCSDRWLYAGHAGRTLTGRIKQALVSHAEQTIIRRADRLFASSRHLFDSLKGKARGPVHLVENGVDYSLFSQPFQGGRNTDRPVLGFIGGLKPWKIDYHLLLEVARRRRGWKFVLIGESYGGMTTEFKALSKQPNVEILPAVPLEEVPRLMGNFDVGLLPYLNNRYNEGVFPLKFFEYLACGLPVVGCGLPSTAGYAGESIYYLADNDSSDFIAACERALECRDANIAERMAVARSADWAEKLKQIYASAINRL